VKASHQLADATCMRVWRTIRQWWTRSSNDVVAHSIPTASSDDCFESIVPSCSSSEGNAGPTPEHFHNCHQQQPHVEGHASDEEGNLHQSSPVQDPLNGAWQLVGSQHQCAVVGELRALIIQNETLTSADGKVRTIRRGHTSHTVVFADSVLTLVADGKLQMRATATSNVYGQYQRVCLPDVADIRRIQGQWLQLRRVGPRLTLTINGPFYHLKKHMRDECNSFRGLVCLRKPDKATMVHVFEALPERSNKLRLCFNGDVVNMSRTYFTTLRPIWEE